MSAQTSTRWRQDTFAAYASARRSVSIPGFTVEPLADLTRHHPKAPDDEALLSLARFDPARADARIDEELAHLRDRGWEGEWKVHDFDQPPDLKARLEARGLRAHHTEALMVLDVDAVSAAAAPPEGIVIEAAHGALLDRIADLQERVWDISLPWLPRVLREMSDPGTGTAEVFCARAGDRIVGSGWIEFHGGSPFAQLCGGAVLADWRGRGIYSALYACRIARAKARGVPWIAVDAAPMSRPILEEKGFRFVCHTYPMRTRPYASAVTRG